MGQFIGDRLSDFVIGTGRYIYWYDMEMEINMSKGIPLIVAGIIFSLVALVHILRLIYHWDVTIAGQIIPMSFSVIGLIVTAFLAIWMFIAASKN